MSGVEGREDVLRDELLGLIARKRATAGRPYREGGSTLYRISPGWEAEIMTRNPAIRKADTSSVLEAALADPDVVTILVPRSAALTFTVARRICARHGMDKTVFFEGEDNEQQS